MKHAKLEKKEVILQPNTCLGTSGIVREFAVPQFSYLVSFVLFLFELAAF
jgi:hypothetical protein